MTVHPNALSRRAFVQKLSCVAALFVLPSDRRHGDGLDHPDARPGITSAHVLSNDALKTSKLKVLTAYDGARKHPAIFDAIACGCSCGDKGTHRSLLVCYETMQPTGCWSCQDEAVLVTELADKNTPLAEIRAAVDKKFG